MVLMTLLTLLMAMGAALRRAGLWQRPQLSMVVLLVALALFALGVGCENYVNPININPVVTGTPSGNFSIVLTGTLGSANSVVRTTIITLSVQPTA
jgi:hypothetical protein